LCVFVRRFQSSTAPPTQLASPGSRSPVGQAEHLQRLGSI
jgi:hypothetical protein